MFEKDIFAEKLTSLLNLIFFNSFSFERTFKKHIICLKLKNLTKIKDDLLWRVIIEIVFVDPTYLEILEFSLFYDCFSFHLIIRKLSIRAFHK